MRSASSHTSSARDIATTTKSAAAATFASAARTGVPTKAEVIEELRTKLLEVETLAKHSDLAAKLAELMPATPDDVKAVFGSKRIVIEDSEIEAVLDIVRQVI